MRSPTVFVNRNFCQRSVFLPWQINRITIIRLLRLSVSDDLKHWSTVRDILNYEDNCFAEDSTKVGFQYPSFIFDDSDILAAVRTALNGAENFHNANHITFHRIRNYAK